MFLLLGFDFRFRTVNQALSLREQLLELLEGRFHEVSELVGPVRCDLDPALAAGPHDTGEMPQRVTHLHWVETHVV